MVFLHAGKCYSSSRLHCIILNLPDSKAFLSLKLPMNVARLRTLYAVSFCIFSMLSARTVWAEPFVLSSSLPTQIEDGELTRPLSYRVITNGVAAGIAFDEGSTETEDRVFVTDLATKSITLGPELPASGYVSSIAVSSERAVLVILNIFNAVRLESPDRVFTTTNLTEFHEIPLPVAEYSGISTPYVDLDGVTYFSQSFYDAQGNRQTRVYSVTAAGVYTELTALPEGSEVYAVSPSGIVATRSIFTSTGFVITILDGKSNTVLRTVDLTGSGANTVRGILDDQRLAIEVGSGVRLYDPRDGSWGKTIKNLYGNDLVPSTAGVFFGFKSRFFGSSTTIFDGTRELEPTCVYPRRDPNRIRASGPTSVNAGNSILLSAAHITKNQESGDALVFLTPDLSSEPPNYCSRVDLQAVGACRGKFYKFGSSLSRSSDAKLPAQCTFRVQFERDATSKPIRGKLSMTVSNAKDSTTTQRVLRGKTSLITLPTSNVRSIFFSAKADKSTPYLDASASVSF